MKQAIHNVVPLSLIALGTGCFWFVFSSWWMLGLFACGVVSGVGLLFLDQRWLIRYYQKDGQSMYNLSYITRSLLFLVALALAGVFVVTSSGSALGTGVVLGMGWWLGFEMWPFRSSLASLNQYLGQEQKPLSLVELQWVWRLLYAWILGVTILAVVYFY